VHVRPYNNDLAKTKPYEVKGATLWRTEQRPVMSRG
jgi:hypothetical protein